MKVLYPSQLMRVTPHTRFKYFKRILRGELTYKPSLDYELKKILEKGGEKIDRENMQYLR
jgi:hypothetical protein